nr:copia protein [Tanacetum cinerariifolium]
MRMEQYFLMIDYSLWEVILNGNSSSPTRIVNDVVQVIAPTTTEQRLAKKNELKARGTLLMALPKQRLAKKNELKARGTLLMALPSKHQLKFNIYKDAKTLMEAIEKGNKANLEDQSLDDLFNNLKIYEAGVKGSSTSSQNKQNIAFMSSNNTDITNETVNAVPSVSAASSKATVSTLPNVDSLSDAVIYSLFASQPNSPQLDNEYLKQIDPDDLEDMDFKWQMAMLTMRARTFLKRTERNLGANGTDTIGFDMSKVECYNSHRRVHFSRECRSPKDNRNKEALRRTVPVEAEEEPTIYALIAYASLDLSSSSGSNNEVAPCSKACSKAYATLQTHYDKLTVDFRKSSFDILSYKTDSQVSDKTGLGYDSQVFNSQVFDYEELLSHESDNSVLKSPGNDRYKKDEGYHAIPPPYTGTFMPSKPDLIFNDAPNASESVNNVVTFESSLNKPRKDMSKTLRPDAPIIKDWIFYSEDEIENENVVPTTVLTRSRLVSLNAARPLPIVVPQSTVKRQSPVKHVVNKLDSPIRRPINHKPATKHSNFNKQGSPQKALKDKDVIDSGCLIHMTGNISYLLDFEEINEGYVAFGGNPKGGKISNKVKIKTSNLDFDDVYFVKELKFNLISVSQMYDKKNSVLFTDIECSCCCKLPILNPNEFDLWKMRMEQYFLMIDYSLWEVILNGNSLSPTRIVNDVVQVIAPTTTEQRNKADLEEQSLDDLFNNLKIYEAGVNGSSTSSQNKQNIAFVSSNKTDITNETVNAIPSVFAASSKAIVSTLPNVDSLSDVVIYSLFASQSNSHQLDNEDLKKIDPNDLEDMDVKWQMAMLTIRARKFLKRTGRNLGANGTDTIGFDMSKVECYNSHIRVYFSRECRSPKDSRNKEALRRTVPVEAEEEPTIYALIAYASSDLSSSLGSNNEVAPCSKACSKAYATLQTHYDKLTVDFKKSSFDILSYKTDSQVSDKTGLGYDSQVFNSQMFDYEELLSHESDNSVLKSPGNDRYKKDEGYDAIPPLYTGTFMPPKPDLIFNDALNASESVDNVVTFESSLNKPRKDMSKTLRPDAPIIEDWIFYSKDEIENESVPKQKEPSFAINQKSKGHKNSWNKKACFVCKSLNHLIKDCDYYEKQMVQMHVWTNAIRVNQQNSVRMTHPYSNRNVVPTTVLTRSRLVSLNAARPVPIVVPQSTVKRQSSVKHVVNKSDSPIRKPINHKPATKHSNFNKHVTTVRVNKGNVVQGTKGNAKKASANWVWKPKCEFLDHVSRHTSASMTLKKFDYTDALGRSKVPRENNTYNVDLKNVVPLGDFTCLFVKATLDESNLWHRRLGHINFKTMNKLVKGNIVRGLPSKSFENNHTCVACKKGKQHRASKFDGKADEGFLVGYSVNSKAFKVFNSRTRIVQETLHINFLENKPNVAGIGPKWLFDIDTLTKSMNYQPVVTGNQPNDNASIQENLDADPHNTYVDVVDAAFDVKEYENDVYVSTSGSDKTDNKKHDEKAKREFSSNSTNRVNAISTPVIAARPNPTNSTDSFNTACPSDTAVSPNLRIDGKSSFVDPSKYPNDPDMPELEDVVYLDDEEDVGAEADLSNLETNISVSPIPITSVFRNKKDERWIVISNKARLVAQGHTQEEDIDYDEVFALVARIEAIRLFLAYVFFMGFMVYQMDVKSAFLYRTIEEEVYICQPLGFKDLDYPDKVYKVVKALYGLHQAPRAWYEIMANYLSENGFQKGKIDQTLFIKKQKGDILLVHVHVDDIIFGSTNKELCKAFKKLMKDKFHMSSMGELTFFLGLQIKQKDDGIFISQDKYVAKILRKFVFTDVKSASTPIKIEKPLLKDPNEDVIRRDLRLGDADGVMCLPNEEIFVELARMGYEKPPPKLTFYKAFFSA